MSSTIDVAIASTLNKEAIVSANTDEKDEIPSTEDGTHVDLQRVDTVELQEQTNLLPVKQVVLVFIGLTFSLFCSLLDQTIITTALPTLGRVFNQAQISSWVGTAYLLTSTAFQPMYGRLSDIFGRKVILIASILIFLGGSLACALSTSMIMLIVFRAIQGIGGGGILTLNLIISADIVPLQDRGKFQGIVGGVIALSNAIGPIVGGVFTEKLSWRWCFYINLPLSAIALIIVIFLLPLKPVTGSIWTKLKQLDYYGALFTLAWVSLVLIAITWAGTTYPWDSPAVLAPLIVGLALLVGFVVVEIYFVRLPLIPMRLFRIPTVAAVIACTFFGGLCFYSTLYYLPQYFQVVHGASAIQSGIDMLPLILVQTAFAFGSGFLVDKTKDYKWNMIVGYAVWTVGLGLMSSTTPSTPYAHAAGFQVITAAGAGQTFQTGLVALQAAVRRKDVAAGIGLRNFARMLGGTIGLAACSTIVNNFMQKNLSSFDEAIVDAILKDPTQVTTLGLSDDQVALVKLAYSRGIDACFWLMCPLAGISCIITVVFTQRLQIEQEDVEAKRAEAKAWLESRKKHSDDKV